MLYWTAYYLFSDSVILSILCLYIKTTPSGGCVAGGG